jgi:hypothetical protein
MKTQLLANQLDSLKLAKQKIEFCKDMSRDMKQKTLNLL